MQNVWHIMISIDIHAEDSHGGDRGSNSGAAFYFFVDLVYYFCHRPQDCQPTSIHHFYINVINGKI